jgi:hypothetical protein
MDWIIREAIEIKLHPDNMMASPWVGHGINPIRWALKNAAFFPQKKFAPPPPPPPMPIWSLPIGPAQFLPHSVLTGPFLQTSLPATLYN